jgi:hypothetical protein
MDLSADSLGVGLVTGDKLLGEKEIFKLGAYCCTCGLAMPELKCNGVGHDFASSLCDLFLSKKVRCSTQNCNSLANACLTIGPLLLA